MTHQLPRHRGQDIGINDQPVDSDLGLSEPYPLRGPHLPWQEVVLSEQPCPMEEFLNC